MKNTKFLKDKLIAHRGVFDNKKVPENSIDAFRQAIDNKYTIELDVRLSKDNKIIVFHDEKLERMTKEKGNVSDYTLKELTSFKLLNTLSTIPSLSEVLKLVDGKVPLLIEIKDSKKGFKLERELIKILDNYNGEFSIQSFKPSTIIYLRLFKNKYIRGLLISENSIKKYNSLKYLNMCKPDFININKDMINNKSLKEYKGIKIIYTVSKKEVNIYKDKCDNMICNI